MVDSGNEGSFRGFGVDGNLFAAFSDTFEFGDAIDTGINGIISALAGIDAGLNLAPSLAIKDITSENMLTISYFRAESPTSAIAAVLGARDAFF